MPERSMEKQSFPLSLALVDALPVLFFGAAAAILGVKLRSVVFIVGAALCLLAGAGKVVWKLLIALNHNECANTNVEAVFDLILQTAVNNRMPQEDLPQNILILSDMEFDRCACTNTGYCRNENRTLFDTIAQRYAAHGYKLPRLVFWNLNSRTGTIPVKENDLGVALVSGFSPTVAKMIFSGS